MTTPAPDQLLFRCHACRQKYAVRQSRIGAKLKCTKCGVVIQVPKENSLDRAEASKPTVHVQHPKVTSSQDSIAELSFDDLPDPSTDSVMMNEPGASAIRQAHENDPQSGIVAPAPKPDDKAAFFDAAPTAADSAVHEAQKIPPAAATPAKAPPGKKLCPNCHHACPAMALSCPLCQHRFEIARPKPKPMAEPAAAVASDSGISSSIRSGIVEGKDVLRDVLKDIRKGAADGAAPHAAGSAKAPAKGYARKDAGKQLDSLLTERKKSEGRPVEAPMWMDEVVYGSAIKMGFAGLCCLVAGLVVFIQLDSPESARHAFFLIKWAYAVGSGAGHTLGRLSPTLLCLGAGAAFLYFAIRPVLELLRREKAAHLADQAAKASAAASLTDK